MNSLVETIRDKIADSEKYVIDARRQIHVFAETGGNEHKTSAFISNELARLGLKVRTVSNTGLIGTLDTWLPGKTLALRADIDALPIPENQENLKQKRTCISENPGACHACGHDAHSAMLLGAARVLAAVKNHLSGKILFCFEEGEEVGLGARGMIEALREAQIDAVWAIHVLSTLDAGKINISPGPRMAGGGRIIMRVNGQGGHGSRPDLAVNPVYAAAAITANISGVLQTRLNPDNPVTVGITSIQGGALENIFPEYAEIKGTMRYFDAIEGEKVAGIIKLVAENTAKMSGCSVEFDKAMEWRGLPVINDRETALQAARAVDALGFAGSLSDCPPWYASESFSAYLKEFPGALAFLGIKNDEFGSGAPHHSERFDIDETALINGLAANVAFAAGAAIL